MTRIQITKNKKKSKLTSGIIGVVISIFALLLSLYIAIDSKMKEIDYNKEKININFIKCEFGNKLSIHEKKYSYESLGPVGWTKDESCAAIPIKLSFIIANTTDRSISINDFDLYLSSGDAHHGFSDFLLYVNEQVVNNPIIVKANESIKLDISFDYFLKKYIGDLLIEKYGTHTFNYVESVKYLWRFRYDIFGNKYSTDIEKMKTILDKKNKQYSISSDYMIPEEKILIDSPIGGVNQFLLMDLHTSKSTFKFKCCFNSFGGINWDPIFSQ